MSLLGREPFSGEAVMQLANRVCIRGVEAMRNHKLFSPLLFHVVLHMLPPIYIRAAYVGNVLEDE